MYGGWGCEESVDEGGEDHTLPEIPAEPVAGKLGGETAGVKTGTELVRQAQNMFGGAVSLKQVRKFNSPIKKCVRSKLNRCVVHRCQFLEEEKTKRILKRDEQGKVGFSMVTEKIWRCASVVNEDCSLPRPIPGSGVLNGGRKDVLNGGKLMDRKWNAVQLPSSRP